MLCRETLSSLASVTAVCIQDWRILFNERTLQAGRICYVERILEQGVNAAGMLFNAFDLFY